MKIEIRDSFDLHSFRPEDLSSVVDEYLDAARLAGFHEVRLIHGKGIGARRAQVRKILSNRKDIASFSDSTPDRGGFGATIAVFADLKPGT